MKRLFDLTHVFLETMPTYGGDGEATLLQTKYLNVDGYSLHQLETNLHVGTHLDAPMHMVDNPKYICEYELSHFIGNGCLLDVRGEKLIKYRTEFEDRVQKNDIVLLYTGHDKTFGTEEYYNDHPVIDEQICRFLIEKEIKILGVDTPSPDKFPFDAHHMLLSNGIFIIEGLQGLEQLIGVEKFEIIAFPLKLKAEASLVRVVGREI